METGTGLETGKRTREVPPGPVLPAGERDWVGPLMVVLGFVALIPVLSMHRVTDFMIFCIYVMAFDLLYVGTGAEGSIRRPKPVPSVGPVDQPEPWAPAP